LDSCGAPRVFKDIGDHAADAIDLLLNTCLGQSSGLCGRFRLARHVRRDADDRQRVLQIMDDGAGESAHQRHALRLNHFSDVLPIELAHALRDLAHHAERELRRAGQHRNESLAWHHVQCGFHFRRGGGGTRLIIDDRELPKHFAGRHARQYLAFPSGNDRSDLNHPRFHDVEHIAGISLFENLRAASKRHFACDAFERNQFGGRQWTE
jgi:hypothetical protein